jgi:hypothetical protein
MRQHVPGHRGLLEQAIGHYCMVGIAESILYLISYTTGIVGLEPIPRRGGLMGTEKRLILCLGISELSIADS